MLKMEKLVPKTGVKNGQVGELSNIRMGPGTELYSGNLA